MEPQYPGLDGDENGGMTYLGQIVKDAWVFGLLPETEQCAGWSRSQMQALYPLDGIVKMADFSAGEKIGSGGGQAVSRPMPQVS